MLSINIQRVSKILKTKSSRMVYAYIRNLNTQLCCNGKTLKLLVSIFEQEFTQTRVTDTRVIKAFAPVHS